MVEILIWTISAFLIGGILVMERRCLGQMAIVQPLPICAITGLAVGNPDTGIWLGISLQLMSARPIQKTDWALVGVVSATSLAVLETHGVHLQPGSPSSILCVAGAFAFGLLGYSTERHYSRKDSARLQAAPLWKSPTPIQTIESEVNRTLTRWMLLGGTMVLIGSALSCGAILSANFLLKTHANGANQFGAVALPLIGLVVLISSLRKYLIVGLAGATTAVLWGVSLI